MQTWSDSPIHPSFTVKFFIDTNILVYLVDNTFQSLTDFIDLSKDSKFLDLVSSKYVIFEFIGVRKREHYLRKVVAASKLSAKGEVNFSSLLNYQNKFDAPEALFDSVIADIKTDVEDELQKIISDYKIDYNYSTLHDDQLHPTSEICLSTKIANQDCLVLISAILPQPGIVSDGMQVLTNDGDFIKFFEEANIGHVFASYKTQKPQIIGINNVKGEVNPPLNLKTTILKTDIETHLKSVLLRSIIEKNKKLFLGKTIIPTSPTFPIDVIPFKFNLNQPAPEKVYITIISKNLDFIYTSRKRIDSLEHSGSPVSKGFIFSDNSKNKVAYKLVDIDSSGNEIPVSQHIINSIREEGNLVFVHPDS